jgi:hypothetical protein
MEENTNNVLPSHFREFLQAINEFEVEYLLIGGYAMGAFGYIRGTGDLDIYINANPANAGKMVTACIEYGIPENELTREMFLVPKMIGIGQPPLRIEIIKKLDTIDFDYAYQRCQIISIDGIQIKVISMDDMILLKQAAVKGRSKDRDIEDLDYLTHLKGRTKSNFFTGLIKRFKKRGRE